MCFNAMHGSGPEGERDTDRQTETDRQRQAAN